MNFLYILKSDKNGRYYVGSTNNIERRLREHNSGKTISLKHLRPLTLVFKQTYAHLEDAKKIEQKLKKAKSRNILKKIIQEGRIRMGP